jgi:bifunctional NMN adenylyltransferase/nudix hydrolase
MIEQSIKWEIKPIIVGAVDSLYSNSHWAKNVQELVAGVYNGKSICIVGHKKDESSFYLDLFPQWDFINFQKQMWENTEYNSTQIREILFSGGKSMFMSRLQKLQPVMPESCLYELIRFSDTEEYVRLVREWEYIQNYKLAWETAPYPPTFVTSDAVVEKSGHVLMVVRGAAPGEGLLALPGGFVNQFESVEDAAIRELREETKLKVPEPVLRGSIKSREVFDNPFRSLRGRTITHAFHIDLGFGLLDKVKGSDDAKHALWVPLSELDPEKIFEDHFSIISKMVGI